MNQETVKEMLLDIERSDLEFSVTFTGKSSKKVNGLYKPDTYEILLHNKNFKTDNQLVYTAIHEYAHHLLNEAKQEAGLGTPKYSRVHTPAFWARFHQLLDTAQAKGRYTLDISASPELAALTEDIQKNYLAKNGELMREFGGLLLRARELCDEAQIRFEDYIDRTLKLPRASARSITKIAELKVNPALGYDNMKLVASLPTEEKRQAAEEQFLSGKSPDSVRVSLRKPQDETDAKTRLEQEKRRLEKTIEQLSRRLETVEENLAALAA
jgi:hypothetical protein